MHCRINSYSLVSILTEKVIMFTGGGRPASDLLEDAVSELNPSVLPFEEASRAVGETVILSAAYWGRIT